MSESSMQVELGDRTYDLVPQRIGRIGRKLGQVVELFSGVGTGNVNTDLGPGLHEALKVFIPDLAPLWQFAGYASEDDYRARERYVEEVAVAREQFAAAHGPKADTEEVSEAGWDDLPPETQAEFTPPDFHDPYDEHADKSPTPPQLIETIETIFALHGGQRMVRLLKNFVSPEMIRAQLKRMQIEAALVRSQNLPRENGASDPTPSTTPSPTPDEADTLGSLPHDF